MDSGIRVSIGAGLGALVLSVLVGAFSRVPLGAILLRAFLLGLLFAGIGYCAVLVFKRFLLDSDDQQQDSFMNAEPVSRGSLVDIVLPEGQPVDYSAIVRDAADAEESSAETRFKNEVKTPLRSQAFPEQGNSSEDLAREVESVRTENTAQVYDEKSAGGGKSVPETTRPSVSMDTLDVLPDLDTLSDSFGSVLPEESGEDSSIKSDSQITGSFSSGGYSSGGGGDPVVLAKAVQTLLRKDQKGQ